nr:MAG: CHC2 zinc finger protein [Bacteriophage sp.]
MNKLFDEVNAVLSTKEVAERLGFVVNRSGFINSPINAEEKTPSCKIYPGNRGFYDFSSGIGGDTLKLASLVLGVDAWKAAQYLIEQFKLDINTSSKISGTEVQKLKQQREADQKRKNVEKSRWVNRVDELKAKIEMYENLLQSEHIPVFSSVWCWCVDLRMKSIVELNEICGLETMSADLKLPIRQELKTRKTG